MLRHSVHDNQATMTAAEFIAACERLGLTSDQAAAEFGVTPHVVSAWERGTLKVSRDVAAMLRWRVALEERQAIRAASGLPECPTAEALSEATNGKERDELIEALERLTEHGDACEVCQAQAEYVERHAPPLPPFPTSRAIRFFAAIDGSFDRLPRWIRPPAGARGVGRRMGLWFGIAFSVLALVIILGAQVRGSLPPAGVLEVLRTLGAITLSYLFGFYGAGAVYDMLLPIGHRFIGYVLRWGLGGAIVYGAIAVMMSLMESSAPMSWRGTLSFALGMGVLWSVIGAGIWVKDRVNGKLPKPVV